MNEKQRKIMIEQQKTFNESFRKHKEVWQGMYTVLGAYTKELKELFDTSNKKVSK
ncbi:MAG: hypothetical protein JSW60_08280 [Thermoplasmatales archaeon]|nr:MAG: hypothetical protein JSW60_08280 [Thermoplasmatales archaeon]